MLKKALIGVVLVAAGTAAACPGDCDEDCSVDVTEIVRGTAIALGESPLASCPGFDSDESSGVEVHEILAAVASALNGCPRPLVFDPPQRVAVGKGPRSLAIADIDGDGAPDAAAANHNSDDVSLLLNDGLGHLRETTRLPVGRVPLGIALADFNRDGRIDVATANGVGGDCSVALARGDGTFEPAQSYAAGAEARTIRAADIDRNGTVDLLIATPGASGLVALLGKGDGTFVRLTIGSGFRSWWVAFGDVTGDGLPDLVSANGDTNDLSVLAQVGVGTFLPRFRLPLPFAPFSVAIADLDGDGDQDLAAGNGRNAAVSILRSNANGFASATTVSFGPGPYEVQAVDIDRDGHVDLLAPIEDSQDGSISIRRGLGGGTFEPELRVPVGLRPYAMAVSDLDRDGELDLLAAVGSTNQVVVRRRSDCPSRVE